MDPSLIAVLAGAAVLAVLGAAVLLAGRLRRRRPGRASDVAWEPDAALSDGHRPPDCEALSSQVLGILRQTLDAKGVVVLVPGTAGWRVTLTSPGVSLRPMKPGPVKEGLLGLALEGEKEITADRVQPQSLGYLPEQSEEVSLAIVPLAHRGRVRGLVACHRAAGRPFEEPEVAVLRRCAGLLDGWETFAAHAGELAKVRDREERLQRGIERMLGEPDPSEIAHFALDALFDILPASVYGFVSLQSNTYHYWGLATKRFTAPDDFQHMDRSTWAYWVMTRGRQKLYLDGATSRDTAMPILYQGEPFTAGAVALLVPLESAGEVFGVAGLVGKPDEPFPESERLAAERFLLQASALMTLAMMSKLNQDNAMRDGLTGLYNRRHFDEQLQKEISRSQRDGTPMALIIADIDHFKRVNDTYGHDTGDLALRAVAHCLKESVRDVDAVCRYGGEEFGIILPNCPPAEAAGVAERAREAVSLLPSPALGGIKDQVTLSAGVASYPSPFTTSTGLIKGADTALYHAKRKGRNRIETAGRRAAPFEHPGTT